MAYFHCLLNGGDVSLSGEFALGIEEKGIYYNDSPLMRDIDWTPEPLIDLLHVTHFPPSRNIACLEFCTGIKLTGLAGKPPGS
jgi:hypothetical protein